jgi:hypothetical protein
MARTVKAKLHFLKMTSRRQANVYGSSAGPNGHSRKLFREITCGASLRSSPNRFGIEAAMARTSKVRGARAPFILRDDKLPAARITGPS